MAMITTTVLKEGDIRTLTSLPRKDNRIFNDMPNLEVDTQFRYLGATETGGGTQWECLKTGKTYPLSAQLFLPPKLELAPLGTPLKEVHALLIVSGARMVRISAKPSKAPAAIASPGTIFSSFTDTNEGRYIVTDNQDNLYTISKSMTAKLVLRKGIKRNALEVENIKDIPSEKKENLFRKKAKTLKPVEGVDCYSFNPETKSFSLINSTDDMVPGVQYYLINTEDGLPVALEKL